MEDVLSGICELVSFVFDLICEVRSLWPGRDEEAEWTPLSRSNLK